MKIIFLVLLALMPPALIGANAAASDYEKQIARLFNIPDGIVFGSDGCNNAVLSELKKIGVRSDIIEKILDSSAAEKIYTTITYQDALTFSWRFLDDDATYINIFVTVRLDATKRPVSVSTVRTTGKSLPKEKIVKAPDSLIDEP